MNNNIFFSLVVLIFLSSCTNKHEPDNQKETREKESIIIYSTNRKSDLEGESITPQLRNDLDSFFINNSWDKKKKLTNELTDSLFKSELSKK